ncbi:hypothetical protein JXL83_10275 [candidate division WOR-3 bacterium]|nr:hypothetical protein [candidate division WOR-3 bacterium]
MILFFWVIMTLTNYERHIIVKEIYLSFFESNPIPELSSSYYSPLTQSENDTLAARAINLYSNESRQGSVFAEETVFVSAEKLDLSWELQNATLFTPERAQWKLKMILLLFKNGDLAGFHESERKGSVDVASLSETDIALASLDIRSGFSRVNFFEFAGVSILCAGLVFAFYYIR